MRKEAWNYPVWQAFHERVYLQSLTHENVEGDGAEEFYENVFMLDDGYTVEKILDENMRSVIRLKKGSEHYLLPSQFRDKLPINVDSYIRLQVKKSDKRVFKLITKPIEMKITPAKGKMTFKEFISGWNTLDHSDTKTWTFLKILAVASQYKGIKMCVCSEPESGKNANFSLINYVLSNVVRIQRPTLAKLETSIYYNRVLLPDEVTSMTSAQVSEMEPMIIVLGDNSTEYIKHSVSQVKKMNIVDISQLSVIFTYNRKQDLSKGGTFFDDKWNNIGAFRTRYPQVLIEGRVTESMPNINKTQAKQIMEENFEDMRAFAKALVYWAHNMHKELHGWDRAALHLSLRHKPNLEGLLDALDVYCESQEEFNEWLKWIDNARARYKYQLEGCEFKEPYYTQPQEQKQLIVEERV